MLDPQFRAGKALRGVLAQHPARQRRPFAVADTGMGASGLAGELVARLQTKVLPVAPNRAELADVFALLFISEHDAEWVAALDEGLIARLAQILDGDDDHAPVLSTLGAALSDSIALLSSQIAAAALEAPIRMRLDSPQGKHASADAVAAPRARTDPERKWQRTAAATAQPVARSTRACPHRSEQRL